MTEQELHAMKLHDTVVVESKAIGNAPPMKWAITRVPTGWIYHEENERIERPPMVVFVPKSN